MPAYPAVDEDDRRPPFPAVVRAAGWLWLAFGAVGLLVGAVAVGLQVRQAGAVTGGTCFRLVLAVGFAVVGLNTVTGRAAGTVGNAVGSLVAAGLHLLAALGAVLAAADRPPAARGPLWLTAAALAAAAAVLAVAGALALLGGGAYADWQAGRPQGRRRRR